MDILISAKSKEDFNLIYGNIESLPEKFSETFDRAHISKVTESYTVCLVCESIKDTYIILPKNAVIKSTKVSKQEDDKYKIWIYFKYREQTFACSYVNLDDPSFVVNIGSI